MPKAPAVSVCLPTLNGETYLPAALESVLSQTCEDFELIVSDDGSDDATREIVESFKSKDKRIVFSINPNRLGLFGNYNFCMTKAKGEYIKPFAQDDLLAPDALQVMLAKAKENPEAALVASCRRVLRMEAGAEQGECASGPWNGLTKGRQVVLECLRRYNNLIGEPVAVLFPRRYAGSGFNCNYFSLGDIEYWMRLLESGDLYYLTSPLVTFREHAQSSSRRLLTDMSWTLDFIRLGHDCKHLLSALDMTEEEYIMGATEKVALWFDDLVVKQGMMIENLEGFKEVAYYCLRVLGRNEHERLYYKAKCESMESSASWRMTEPLRKLRAAVGQVPVDGVDD